MSLSIAPGAIVCNESVLIGDISIGSRTVVHPKVIIIVSDLMSEAGKKQDGKKFANHRKRTFVY